MMNPTNEALADALAEELLEEAAHGDACEASAGAPSATAIRLSLVARSLEATLRGARPEALPPPPRRVSPPVVDLALGSTDGTPSPVGQWIELMSRDELVAQLEADPTWHADREAVASLSDLELRAEVQARRRGEG